MINMYGLLGEKLSHSFSVDIHQILNPSISYNLYETRDLETFFSTAVFEGLNVTHPYKEAVIPLLDKLDASSIKTNAVNTIIKTGHHLIGYNTDYMALKHLFSTTLKNAKKASFGILGNGATMRSIKHALYDLNHDNITVYARNPQLGEKPLECLEDKHDYLINATPVGMYPHNDQTIADKIKSFKNITIAMDLIYNPLRSNFLLNAKQMGAKIINGLPLLFLQAAYAQKIWELCAFPTDWQKRTEFLEKQLENIVLIGMPFSGKSHYGYLLEKMMQKKFVDIDRLIEEKAHTDITTIIKTSGEETFRALEHETTIKAAKRHRQIIATGGGIIQNKMAMQILKQNGLIVWLDVSDNLAESKKLDTRPLLDSFKDWQITKKRRYHNYKAYADIIIEKNTEDETIILNRLKEALDGYFGH